MTVEECAVYVAEGKIPYTKLCYTCYKPIWSESVTEQIRLGNPKYHIGKDYWYHKECHMPELVGDPEKEIDWKEYDDEDDDGDDE